MKKLLPLLLIILLITGCSKKDDQLWLLGLLGGNDDSSQSVSGEASGSDNSDSSTPAASGDENSPAPSASGDDDSPAPSASGDDDSPAPSASGDDDSPAPSASGDDDSSSPAASGDDDSQLLTIAFEDSFPQAGDGDYNDYVVVASYSLGYEGDNIRRIEAVFNHVARGSGFRQALMLQLPVNTNASFRQKIYYGDGTVKQSETLTSVTSQEMAAGLVILPDDSSNSPRNVSHGQEYEPGMKAEVEIIFDSPVVLSGNFPYGLHLDLPNRNQKIFITDINNKGFPAAVIVPGIWKWQYNGSSLYRDNSSGYGDFDDWVKNGSPEEWYNNVTDATKIYPVPETDIAGFIQGKSNKNIVLISMVMLFVGIFLGFYLRKKTISA